MTAALPSGRCPRTLLLFGAVGFLAGFLGPIVLNPEANQGPLLGIFITGPLGLLLGACACLLQRLVPGLSRTALRLAAAAFGLVTLYYCLPEPALVGRVIEAQIEDCVPPQQLAAAALSRWEQALARTPWAHPQPDWKQAALRNVEHFEAAVLSVRITRSSAVYVRRKPWDHGKRFALPWAEEERSASYFVRGAAGACPEEPGREPRALLAAARRRAAPGAGHAVAARRCGRIPVTAGAGCRACGHQRPAARGALTTSPSGACRPRRSRAAWARCTAAAAGRCACPGRRSSPASAPPSPRCARSRTSP